MMNSIVTIIKGGGGWGVEGRHVAVSTITNANWPERKKASGGKKTKESSRNEQECWGNQKLKKIKGCGNVAE